MNLSSTEIRLLNQSLTTSINLATPKTQTHKRLVSLRGKVGRYAQYVAGEKTRSKVVKKVKS